MKKKIILIISIAMGILAISFLVWFFFINKTLVIEKYPKEETIEVFNEYNVSKPKVCYGTYFNCKEIDYHIDNPVDSNVVDIYTINYDFHYENNMGHFEKTVNVIDSVSPELSIDGPVKYCKNGKLLGNNFKAADNYDGDISSKIIVSEEENKYYASIKDTSGNETKKEVEAVIDTSIKPTIKLNDSTVYLLVGEKYQEPGYKASDSCDGNITSKVKVSGSVNSDKVGNYTLTYSVTNSSGNTTSVTRKVYVIKKNDVIYPSSKVIYLTFDDGPGPYTSKLLNILDKYNVKVTFFVTNQFGNSNYLKLIKEEAKRGHAVGVHSYSHEYKNVYSSINSFWDDFNKMNNIIEKQTGEQTRIYRFPGGSSNTISRSYSKGIVSKIAKELTSKGYSYFDWNVSAGDAGGGCTTSSCVYNKVKNGMTSKYINVLMHDIKPYTVDAIEDIIKAGLSKGYTFMAINVNSPTFHQGIAN